MMALVARQGEVHAESSKDEEDESSEDETTNGAAAVTNPKPFPKCKRNPLTLQKFVRHPWALPHSALSPKRVSK